MACRPAVVGGAVRSKKTSSSERSTWPHLVTSTSAGDQRAGQLGAARCAASRAVDRAVAGRRHTSTASSPATRMATAAPGPAARPAPAAMPRAAQLGHGALDQQPAAGDDADPVADLLHLAEQVAGQQHGLPAGGEVDESRAHVGHAGRVQPVGRLVEDQQVRVAEQRRGHAEALLHAERVRPEPVAAAIGRGRPAPAPRSTAPVRHAAVAGQHAQVVPPGQVRVEARSLDQRADPGDRGRVARRPPEHRRPCRRSAGPARAACAAWSSCRRRSARGSRTPRRGGRSGHRVDRERGRRSVLVSAWVLTMVAGVMVGHAVEPRRAGRAVVRRGRGSARTQICVRRLRRGARRPGRGRAS